MKKISIFIFTFLLINTLTAQSQLQSQSTSRILSDEDYANIAEGTKEKVKELESYIIAMTDKGISHSIKQQAVSNAVKLFSSEDNIVQVSNTINSNIDNYPIRQYFNHIMVLGYSRVEIKWYDVEYYTDLHLGSDGRYYAIVTVFQKFEGYQGDNMIYSDETQKNIEIEIDIKEDPHGGTFWKVALGDISVVQTR
jgi:hypothetical protein